MKICKYCETLNDDSQSLCKSCGGLLPEAEKADKQKKSGSKHKFGVGKIIAAILVAVLAVGICTSVLAGGTSHQIDQALGKNQEAIVEAVSVLPQLNAAGDNIAALNDGGKFTVKLGITADIMSVAGTMDYNRKDKVLAGTMTYANEEQGLDVKFDFASDNREFTLTADRYTDDIYGFKLKAFADFYAKTPLALFFPLENSKKEPNVEFFKKIDLSKGMEKKYGEAWKNFRKSLGYEELNEREMEISGQLVHVRAYEITWDTTAASKLISTILGREKGHLADLVELFKVMEPDCRFYVDENGFVVAMDFVTAGNKCTVKFEGSDNIWDQCMLTSLSVAGGEGTITGYLTIDDGEVGAEFEWDDMMAYELEYSDSTGKFIMSAWTGDVSWYLDGALTSQNGGSQLRVGGYLPSYGRVDFSMEVNQLEKEPELMDDKYVDLMDMDMSNWQRLLIDITNSQ